MKKQYLIMLGMLFLIGLVSALTTTYNPFTSKLDYVGVQNENINISDYNITANYFFGNGMGLGTTDPATTLEVGGTGITVDGPISTDSILYFTSSDHVRNDWHVTYNVANTGLDFIESGKSANRLFLHDGGNVGIGTATPATALDVSGTITVNHTILGNGDNVKIGDAGDDTHSLTADDDLFVSGKLEVDGDSYFDGVVSFFSTIGTALNLNGFALYNILSINSSSGTLDILDNTSFSGDLDIHYGKTDINNDLNPQADIKQGDTNNLLLFNRTIDGSNIIFDSPQNLPFKFNNAMVILSANATTMTCDTDSAGGIYYDGVDYMMYFCNSTAWRAMA